MILPEHIGVAFVESPDCSLVALSASGAFGPLKIPLCKLKK
jgi:hypothetical protein